MNPLGISCSCPIMARDSGRLRILAFLPSPADNAHPAIMCMVEWEGLIQYHPNCPSKHSVGDPVLWVSDRMVENTVWIPFDFKVHYYLYSWIIIVVSLVEYFNWKVVFPGIPLETLHLLPSFSFWPLQISQTFTNLITFPLVFICQFEQHK